MVIKIKPFDELKNSEIYEILRLRSMVFVVEQKCIYNDIDDLDQQAMHLLLKLNQQLVGYARLLKAGERFAECSVGRVVVHPDYRGKHYGKKIMQMAAQFMELNWHTRSVAISAQEHLRQYYEHLGYEKVSETYLEDEIPHIKMILTFR